MTRSSLAKLLADSPVILRATLVERYFKCGRLNCRICARQGGHGPRYYLSVRGEDGKTHMIYVAKARLEEARAGVAAWKRLKEALEQLAAEELEGWRGKSKRKGRKR